jgi:formate hydrogenlyase subunit 4
MSLAVVLNLLVLIVLPLVLTGVINRVKSLWSGRKGPPILQPAYDLLRLLRKASVYSRTTTPVFRVAPLVLLVSSLASALISPLAGGQPLLSFSFDFVWLAYLWGLGRMGLVLAALDTGSSFEGMGAAREATFATLLEPVVFLVAGALCAFTRSHSLHLAFALHPHDGASLVAWAAALLALLIVVQVEAARMPVDDPSTHLELTMIHEVMVLDHSGVELAAIQLSSAVKLLVGTSLIASLLNPWSQHAPLLAAAANVGGCVLVAVLIGTVESLIARLKLRAVPQYIAVAISLGVLALLATAWRSGGVP